MYVAVLVAILRNLNAIKLNSDTWFTYSLARTSSPIRFRRLNVGQMRIERRAGRERKQVGQQNVPEISVIECSDNVLPTQIR